MEKKTKKQKTKVGLQLFWNVSGVRRELLVEFFPLTVCRR